jgi:hypothetical protein
MRRASQNETVASKRDERLKTRRASPLQRGTGQQLCPKTGEARLVNRKASQSTTWLNLKANRPATRRLQPEGESIDSNSRNCTKRFLGIRPAENATCTVERGRNRYADFCCMAYRHLIGGKHGQCARNRGKARPMKKYYTLCELEGGKWSVAFGAYSRSIVEEELRTMRHVDGIPSNRLCVITTGDTQAEIMGGVAALNAN